MTLPGTSSFVWEPVFPPPVIIVLGVLLSAVACWIYLGKNAALSVPKRVFLLIFRLAVIILLCLLLLQPMREQSIPRRSPQRVTLVALDTSQSMNEKDGENQATRLDTARRWLLDSGLTNTPDLGEVRMFTFQDDARSVSAKDLAGVAANGATTRIHHSLQTVLESLRSNERCAGLFVFSDGHDFEQVSAARTGQMARAKQAPIFPVPVGRYQTVTDVAVRLASYQPYTFVKQKTRLQATLRLIGCENRRLRVELRRAGQVVREQVFNTGTESEVPVGFEVSEEKPGQYEYEIRCAALPDERETANNSAFTFLNVTDAKMRVLVLEGQPHWDTTFLQRTLMRNERMDVDAITTISSTRMPRMVRSTPALGPLTLPANAADYSAYSLIILGRQIERALPEEAITGLVSAVRDGGASVVLVRGHPGNHAALDGFDPAGASGAATGPVRLTAGRGTEVLPMELLDSAAAGANPLPDLPLVRAAAAPKSLVSVEAMAEGTDGAAAVPAVYHRRLGSGQVLSFAVEGLWRWSLNGKSQPDNNLYDRFWNQLLMNLLQRSNAIPADRPQLGVLSANVQRGEKVHFTFRLPKGLPGFLPKLTLYYNGERLRDVPLASAGNTTPATTWKTEMIAERAGRYRAELLMPDGTRLESNFAAYEEAQETTDTAPDMPYMKRLAEASGGRLLDATSLIEMIGSLKRAAIAESNASPITRRVSAWDRLRVIYFICALLAVDWFFRRRWGWV